MRIAIYGQVISEDQHQVVFDLIERIAERNWSVCLHRTFAKQFGAQLPDIKLFEKHRELTSNADFLFSVGGDGTLLNTIGLVRDSGIPVLGINVGRLGFLSSIKPSEIDKALDEIEEDKVVLDQRTLIQVKINGDTEHTMFALNDVTLQKRDNSSMITIEAHLGEQHLNTYWADGLIISTPTGATAYSLSCGGPIVSPELSSWIVTPIAPHNLNVRPLVIGDGNELQLTVTGRGEKFMVSADSRSKRIDMGTKLTIRKAEHIFNIVRLSEYDYYTNLRSKLNWGLDQRN